MPRDAAIDKNLGEYLALSVRSFDACKRVDAVESNVDRNVDVMEAVLQKRRV